MGVKLIDKGSIEKLDRKLFLASMILAVINFAVTLLMYLNVLTNNFITYFTWPIAIALLLISFRKLGTIEFKKISIKDPFVIVLLVVTVVYFFTHFYNFSNAPWNTYGLFDDGAWDIFDARKMCFTSNRFELIFWDENIGLISRELVFHYYITILFKIFGYNLIIFLAAILEVPVELIEAAKLEKASKFKIFWRIIFPLTSSTAFYVFVITFSHALSYVFTPISVITAGGPNYKSTNVVYQIYEYAFKNFQSGRAAAAAIFTLILVLFVVILYQALEKKVHYEN